MTKSIHILIAEDDKHIRQGLVDTLESEGYGVMAVSDGAEALKQYRQSRYDLLILDIMMPELNGYEVCREIRKQDDSIPIIMLTAKGEEVDKVLGLQLGTDDYVVKPFGIRELLARIAAVLRRSKQQQKPDSSSLTKISGIFHFGHAEIDRKKYIATNGKQHWKLTAHEMKLIECFYSHPNEVLSRDALLNAVWGIQYMGTTRTLDQHIAQLRKKIEPHADDPQVIITVHGIGYEYRQSSPSLLSRKHSISSRL